MKKLIIWVMSGFAVAALCAWMLTIVQGAFRPLVIGLSVIVYAAPSVGALWMLYAAVRTEKNPLRFIVTAFIPFSFLWYYFERVRPRTNV
jgi:hypothetical protein